MGGTDTAVAAAPPREDESSNGEGTTAAHTRLPYEPALDGLRGLAVFVVLAFHMRRLPGGFMGVDLFFVLSGFLITSLLLSEARRSEGGIGLRAFWARRARRLLPALWLVLVAVAGLLLIYTPDDQRYLFRDDALGTLGYVANWQRMFQTASYWDIFTHPSPLDHMWSLAIEEQFYLVWPLVMLLLVRRGDVATRVRRVAFGGAVVSLVWLAVSYKSTDTTWAYYSTPTRLGPTLLGAALAAMVIGRPRREAPPSRGWDIGALVAGAVMLASVVWIDGFDPTYYRGGLAVFAVAACVTIRAVTGGPPGLAARLLSWRPIRWLGTISYGVYLWHWPVFVYLSTDRVNLDRWSVDVLRFGVTLALATLSFHLLEQPIRRGALHGRRLYLTSAGVLAVTTAAVLVATTGEAPPTYAAPGGDGEEMKQESLAEADLQGVETPFVAVPEEKDIPDDAVRVLLVGDSGAGALGWELFDEAPEMGTEPPVVVAFESSIDCSIVWADGPARSREAGFESREWCGDDRIAAWEHIVDEFKPDVVAYYLANAGFVVERLLDGEWVKECEPAYDTYLQESLVEEAELLSADGAEVVFLTSPYTGTGREGMGQEVDCRNATIQRAADDRPGTRVLDLNGFLLTHEDDDRTLFADPVHLSAYGARLVSDWLVPQVAAWEREQQISGETAPGG